MLRKIGTLAVMLVISAVSGTFGARAEAIAVSGEMQSTPITTNTLTGTYPEHASSLFNQVKQCEDEINAVQDKDE